MTDSASKPGRRTWMKQAVAVAGGVAAGLAGSAAGDHAALEAAADDTRVATPNKTVVDTSAGKVRGFARNGVHIFRGIPYGDTTAGANRFLAPPKPKPWTDVRSSTPWGPVSPAGPRGGWRNDEKQFLYQ